MKFLAPLIPYITIAAGLYWAHSAWAAILAYHAGLLIILLAGRSSFFIGTLFKSNHFAGKIGYCLLGAGSGLAVYLLWPVFNIVESLPTDLANIGMTPFSFPAFIVYASLVNPWVEEAFWRGYLGSLSKGLIPNDIFFSGFHLLVLYGKTSTGWLLFAFILVCIAGWLWRQMACRTGGLLTPAVSHLAADFSLLMAVYLRCVK